MKRFAIAMVTVLAVATLQDPTHAQTLDARRTAMGGVMLATGPSHDASNVAYRAVPAAKGSSSGLTLPIGLIPLLSDPPVLDPDDPEFNVYKLANTLYNPPWNLQLTTPEAPSNDITVSIGRDYLSVQLGEVGQIFPEEGSRIAAMTHAPTLGFGIRGFFVGATALVHYDNDLSLNSRLHAALADGEPFQPNTEYALYDDAQGQAVAAVALGWAGALSHTGDPRAEGSGLYVGTRSKILRGLAYGEAHNSVAFTTLDTLFSSSPVDISYNGTIRSAGPDGGGMGRAFDVGAVWLSHGFEIGVGVNDLASQIDWTVKESVVARDTVTGDYVQSTVNEAAAFKSTLPQTVTVNVAKRFGSLTIAADVVNTLERTVPHLGVEQWFGPLALRAGGNIDSNHMTQGSGGVGVKLGRFGVDVAIASHSRTLSRERGLELGAGLSLYH